MPGGGLSIDDFGAGAPDAVPAGASGRDFAVGEGAVAAGRTVAAARTAGGRAAIMAEVLQCHVFARPDFAMGGPHCGAPRGPIAYRCVLPRIEQVGAML